jgi:hypothetical protein
LFDAGVDNACEDGVRVLHWLALVPGVKGSMLGNSCEVLRPLGVGVKAIDMREGSMKQDAFADFLAEQVVSTIVISNSSDIDVIVGDWVVVATADEPLSRET